MAATTICRLISASSSTRRRSSSSSRCSRSRSIRAFSSDKFQRDLFALGEFARLHLDFVDLTATGDLALFDLFLVVDPRLGEVALLNEFRLLDFLARGKQGLFAFLIANGAVAGEFDPLRRAAHLDVVLLRESRIFAFAVDIERLALRVEVLGADFDLRALLDLVAHAPARFDRLGELGQALGVEGVGTVEEFEMGLIEIDDRDAFEFEAVL